MLYRTFVVAGALAIATTSCASVYATGGYETPVACPQVALIAPPDNPALGGSEAAPGPKIGVSQPIMPTVPAACYVPQEEQAATTPNKL